MRLSTFRIAALRLLLILCCLCAMHRAVFAQAVFTVTNTNDSGAGSLRAAIANTSTAPGSTINFAIPTADPNFAGGVFTIRPTTQLPAIIAAGVTIDGTTQTTATGNTNPGGPEILINGATASPTGSGLSGLTISAARCTIRGIIVNGFDGDGIELSGTAVTGSLIEGCYIGTNATGTAAVSNGTGIRIHAGAFANQVGRNGGTLNIISGNASYGILIESTGSNRNIVVNNYIGLNPAGTAAVGNRFAGVGIFGGAQSNVIGQAGVENFISGNTDYGVLISDSGTNSNSLTSNRIGLNATETAALNAAQQDVAGVAILGGARSNRVASCSIAGNAGSGVLLQDTGTTGNIVTSCNIGSSILGNVPNGSHGVLITAGASSSSIDNNLIANNLADGVAIHDSTSVGNTIRNNTIENNVGLGINLEAAGESTSTVTANDTTDADTGPNNLQNYPDLQRVTLAGTTATIVVRLTSRPNTNYALDFFRQPTLDASGFGEGATAVATVNVNTGATGTVTTTVTGNFTGGASTDFVTATATNLTTGDTSEFSRGLQANGAAPLPTPTPAVTPTPTPTTRPVPTPTPTLAPGTATLLAWGYNDFGQIGDGTRVQRNTPVAVSRTTITAVAAGGAHTLELLGTGTVLAWGYNGGGQLGDGTRIDRLRPVAVRGLTNIIAISAGWYHSLALRNDGTVFAWGDNSQGQLGDGTTRTRLVPAIVPGLANVRAIASGLGFNLALLNDGRVFAWGDNRSGQLGDGTRITRLSPVQVRGLTGVTAIAAGGFHAFAIVGGTLRAWGNNDYGQLGTGTLVSQTVPVAVPRLTGIRAVAAGYVHSIALTTGGLVYAWGDNSVGQVGDGTASVRTSPVLLAGVTGADTIAAGTAHNLVRLRDGTLTAWGFNLYGSLGDGTTQNRTSPMHITRASSVSLISAGYGHSVVLGVLRSALVARSFYSGGSVVLDGNNIHLQFTAPLDPSIAGAPERFKVQVNGQTVAVENVILAATQNKIVLSLPPDSLHSGDTVSIDWRGLLDSTGTPIASTNVKLQVK